MLFEFLSYGPQSRLQRALLYSRSDSNSQELSVEGEEMREDEANSVPLALFSELNARAKVREREEAPRIEEGGGHGRSLFKFLFLAVFFF